MSENSIEIDWIEKPQTPKRFGEKLSFAFDREAVPLDFEQTRKEQVEKVRFTTEGVATITEIYCDGRTFDEKPFRDRGIQVKRDLRTGSPYPRNGYTVGQVGEDDETVLFTSPLVTTKATDRMPNVGISKKFRVGCLTEEVNFGNLIATDNNTIIDRADYQGKDDNQIKEIALKVGFPDPILVGPQGKDDNNLLYDLDLCVAAVPGGVIMGGVIFENEVMPEEVVSTESYTQQVGLDLQHQEVDIKGKIPVVVLNDGRILSYCNALVDQTRVFVPQYPNAKEYNEMGIKAWEKIAQLTGVKEVVPVTIYMPSDNTHAGLRCLTVEKRVPSDKH